MNYQGSGDLQQQLQQQTSNRIQTSSRPNIQQLVLQPNSQPSRNAKMTISSSPTAIQKKNLYQAQMQQLNLPAVNQSRSDKSLENSSGYVGINQQVSLGQTQRLGGGAQTARGPQQSDIFNQLAMQQHMNAMNQQQQVSQQMVLKQSQNEKIKSYSRKLAKLVSSTVQGGGSASNSRTPNAKKKFKPTTQIGITSSVNNPQLIKGRSGQNTSRAGQTPLNIIAAANVYAGLNERPSQIGASGALTARPTASTGQLSNPKANTTFDLEEHIRNVIKSVERRSKQPAPTHQVSSQQLSNQQIQQFAQGFMQEQQVRNASQLMSTSGSMVGGSRTARNNVLSQLNEYSPENRESMSKSPKQQQMFNQVMGNSSAQKSNAGSQQLLGTIFSNFSNNTYFIAQKKGQQSHSLGKKSSYQGPSQTGVLASSQTIMLPKQHSNSRKRGSQLSKRMQQSSNNPMEALMKGNSSRIQDSDVFSATRGSIRNFEDQPSLAGQSMRMKRASLVGMNQQIPSHAAYVIQAKKHSQQMASQSNAGLGGSKTARVNTSSYNMGPGMQNTSQHSGKKNQNWFSPPQSFHYQGQPSITSAPMNQVLSSIDNNQSLLKDQKSPPTQFVSPRSFLNKSGQLQMLNNLLMQGKNQGDPSLSQTPLMMTSYDANDENAYINQVDWQKMQQLGNTKFMKKLVLRRHFKLWRDKVRKQTYDVKRNELAERLFIGKGKIYADAFKQVFTHLNTIKTLSFSSTTGDSERPVSSRDEGMKQFQTGSDKSSVDAQWEKRKQNKINQFNDSIVIVRQSLEKLQAQVHKQNLDLERRLKESGSVGRKSLGNEVSSTKSANAKKIDLELQKEIGQRTQTYDRFIQLALVALSSSLSYLLANNKGFLTSKLRVAAKFQILGGSMISQDSKGSMAAMYQTNSDFFMALNPSLKQLPEVAKLQIEESEQLVFNNRKLIENLTKITQLFLTNQKTKWDVNSIYSRIDVMNKSNGQNLNKDQILDLLNRDIDETQGIVRRLEDLKQILQFEERWSNLISNSQNQEFSTDLESNRETWTLMERFQDMINQIPLSPIKLRLIQIDFKPLYDQVSKIPKKVIQQIERKVVTSLELDAQALKQDLKKAYEILQQTPTTLNIYVEQVNTVKVIKDTMGELSSRHDSIKKLSQLCKSDNRFNVKDSVLSVIRELEAYLEQLPLLLRQSSDRLEIQKPQMQQQMKQSCQNLTTKIKAFEKKYLDHYVLDQSKLQDPQHVIGEIKYRQKMIDEIKAKVELYQDCINIMQMKEYFAQSKDITCFQDYQQLIQLHEYTLKLWSLLDEWRKRRTSLMQTAFLKLDFIETANFVEEACSFFEQKYDEDRVFREKLGILSQTIGQEMQELQVVTYLLRDLKKESLKQRHWLMISDELNLGLNPSEFSLQDLVRSKVYSQHPVIMDIVKIADAELEYENQLNFINQSIDSALQFKLIPYKEGIQVLSEFDIIQSQLEEYQVVIKKALKSIELADVLTKDKFKELQIKVLGLSSTLEKVLDSQKMFLTLDAIFSQQALHKALPNDTKKFLELKKLFKNVSAKLQENPTLKGFSNIHSGLTEQLDKISSKGTLIQKSLEDYLEVKRLAFPRFFFMTDKQFLEFIELAEGNLDFNRFINLLFPGVNKVFLDQPLNADIKLSRVPPPIVNDLSQVKSEMIEVSADIGGAYKGRMINQKEVRNKIQGVFEEDESEFNSKQSQQSQTKPTQVLGLVSQLNELFLFEKKVQYQSNKFECWLQGSESSMQETVGKLINYAVNTFPKQSLDEWILDYPQQVILTTIHLILTHEINELFEEMRKDKEAGENGAERRDRNNSDNQDDSDEIGDYSGATPKTPDTRDLIKNSQMSLGHHRTLSQHISQKSSIRFMMKKEEEAGLTNKGKKVSTHEYRDPSSSSYSSARQKLKQHTLARQQQHALQHQYFTGEESKGGNQYIQIGDSGEEDEFNESELEALDLSRERKKFAANMFGSDFDINLIADNKDDTMRILQEKSFRGLYLRLQFWINQICKSLYMSKQSSQDWKQSFEKDMKNFNAPEAPKLNLDLHPVQRLVMQTIINFLSYMRDVVYELKSKKVDNVEDFDWQKQMRLTWNGKDAGCKVDCGAWTTQQANEYLGSQQRIPLTPLTNKYFVFISAAFREKSAVLFRTVPSHDYCGDIFKEFSSICSVPFKDYQCNPKHSMKSLMQFLNGAALASVWIFFEHVDKLDYVHLQTFNKEIQMVQQQFIIAELSQDSSVITAHITVGNQSISQCQRSIERIREQASLESKQQSTENQRITAGPLKLNHVIAGGADIKVEDNIPNYGNFDDEEEEKSVEVAIQQDKLARQSSRHELQFKKRSSQEIELAQQQLLQNLSQLELEEDGNEDFQQLEEDNQLQIDNENLTAGQSKIQGPPQNKVCFGVFASLSHQFNLKREKWALEVSTALQSAFRVLSLTKPEMPVIISMMLKSEAGFLNYKALAAKADEVLVRVASDLLKQGDREDTYTITIRDLRRMIACCKALMDQEILKFSKEKHQQNQQIVRGQRKTQMMSYMMERKSKSQILADLEDEDSREGVQKRIKEAMEERVLIYSLQIFLYEKLYSHFYTLKIAEDKVKKEIKELVFQVFGKEQVLESDKAYSSNQSTKVSQSGLDQQIQVATQACGMTLNSDDRKKVKLLAECLIKARPVGLVGKKPTGKSSYIKIVSKQILKKANLHVDSQAIGSYRELYGIYDPFSTTQQVMEQQLGQVKHSIFSVLKNHLHKTQSILVIDGHFDQIFNETLLLYLEYQSFRETPGSTFNALEKDDIISVTLPNGIQEGLKRMIPIVYEFRTLDNTSPRFVSAIQIINMRDSIDLKEFSSRMKAKLLQRGAKYISQSQTQIFQESITYTIDQIVIPAINELKKAKYIDKAQVELASIMTSTLNFYSSLLSCLKGYQNIEQSLIKIALMTILYSVGNQLTNEGRKALEEIFSSMKSQLGVRGSLFDYYLEQESLEIKELRPFLIDNEVIPSANVLRCSYWAKTLLKNGYNISIVGQPGSQKSTILRYLTKNYQHEFSSKQIRIPSTCFLNQRALRSILSSGQADKSKSQDSKPLLYIIEDLNISADCFNFNPMTFLSLVRNNQFKVFSPDQLEPLTLAQKYVTINTCTKRYSRDHQVQFYSADLTTQDQENFMKIYIQQKLNLSSSQQTQVHEIIFKQMLYLREHSKTFDVSQRQGLFNQHILSNLITKINVSSFKDQNLVETIVHEFSRGILDRVIYPNHKEQAIKNLVSLIKADIKVDFNLTIEEADNIVQFSGQRLGLHTENLEDLIGQQPLSIKKQVTNIAFSLRRANTHHAFISSPGSTTLQVIQTLAEKLKFNIEIPDAAKFRDSMTFVDQINKILSLSVRNQKKTLVLLKDFNLNDLSYIDYVLNLIQSMKEASINSSLSHFNTLDAILQKGLRSALIESAREIHNQQISHSPHSGISSPASPSSLTTSITDSQLLMSALTKLSTNLHFILSINQLQYYHQVVTSYPQLEHQFQIAFIPDETYNSDASLSTLLDVKTWICEFSENQVFDERFIQLLKKGSHAFNNQENGFFIREGQEGKIFNDGLFDPSDYAKVNQDLNLSIPTEYCKSSIRFELFIKLYHRIKQVLYKNLSSQKQHYQSYYDHYVSLQADYMKKLLTKDSPQISKHHLLAFNLLGYQEKIDALNFSLKQKDSQLKQFEKERSDLTKNLDKVNNDVHSQKESSDVKLTQLLARLKQISGQEYRNLNSAITAGQLNDSDMEIIQGLQGVLQSKRSLTNYFSQPEELINRLTQVSQQGVPEQICNKYLKVISKKISQSNEYDKPLYGTIIKILNELLRRSTQDKKSNQVDNKVLQLKEQLSRVNTSILLYTQQLNDMREEVEDLLIKEKNLKSELRDVLRRIDMKDLKILRNDHKLKSLLKQGKKSERKLDKVKIRIKNLEGDCIILACSIAYLGAFSVNERMEIRKQIAEKLMQREKAIEVSEYWQNTQSEQTHNKYFKKIIQNDLGLRTDIFAKLNHLFVDSLFSEFFFSYIFSPTTPVIFDSVGNYQQFLSEDLLDELEKFKVKVVFGSDYMIQEKIKAGLGVSEGKGQLIFVNDICDHSKSIMGKCQDQSILHNLSSLPVKQVPGILSENSQVSLPHLTVFSANQHFNLNPDYLSHATVFNATYVNKNEAWIEIKQILLKHFLPDNYSKLIMIKTQTQSLRIKLSQKQRAFDQLFMCVKNREVEERDHKQLEEIRQCYLDMKQLDDDYQQFNQAFHNLINEHPLLASYSNIFVIELTKFTEEITYSWKIYTKVIDMIIAKIIRDLTMKQGYSHQSQSLKNKDNEESEGEEGGEHDGSGGDLMKPERKKKKKDKEFTIDEEFFHSVIMPSIYSTIVAGIKQEHVSLFNLLFSLEIALKKTTVAQEDKDFFVQRFFRIKNCYDWRLNPHKPSTIPSGFVDGTQRIKQNDFMSIKRDILKIYPDLRKLFETIEIKIGKEFTYKDANTLLYQKLFKAGSEGQYKDLPLIKKLNVGFLCPDDEWRSKVCQFVYEELTTIFDFTEDLNKLHNFIKTASWSLPVALFTSNSINIVNTVCSIASYYGVGLEVLRTDYQQSIKKHERYYQNKEVNDNFQVSPNPDAQDKPLSNEAACTHYEQIDPTKEDKVRMQKANCQRMFAKDELEIDDKQITQNQSSIQLIEKCAENGTWVLISTLKFPSFWYKISRRLEKMAKKGKVLNTFRLFFDLQGYSLQEIPESFLFNHSVKFYLTEKNNEDMEGFNDVWANILNDDLLNAKDLHNVPVLEPPSDLIKVNLNLESNMYESSIDSMLPPMQGNSSKAKDQMNPNAKNKNVKAVKDDKITYSMSQSKDSIILPQIFTQDHLKDIMMGGNDLMSPRDGSSRPKNQLQKNQMSQIKGSNIDDISEISMGHYRMSSGLMSGQPSILLMDDMSKMEGAFMSELNQAFARKMSSNQPQEEAKQQQKYEMVKKPVPQIRKGAQPPPKH